MTVNTNTPIAGPYAGDGTNTEFPYAFRVGSLDHLVVGVTVGDAAEVLYTTGFTATGVGEDEGGVVTFPTSGDPVASGSTVRILRNVPYEQPYRIGNQGPFLPEQHEAAFDNLAMQIQQLASGGLGTAAGEAATAAEQSAIEAAASAASAAASASGVDAYALLAQRYANEDEDVLVEGPDQYSAKHWAQKASDFAGGDAYGDLFSDEIAVTVGHAVVFSDTDGKHVESAGFAPANASHTHDDRYYTESEVDALIANMLVTGNIGSTVQGYSAQLAALAALTGHAFGRELITKSSESALRTYILAAARTQTDEGLPFFLRTLTAETIEDYYAYMPHAGTLTSLRMKIRTGTSIGVRLRKNGANWDGGVRTVTTTLQDFTASLPLTWNAGDRIGLTLSSPSGSPADLHIMGIYTRVLA